MNRKTKNTLCLILLIAMTITTFVSCNYEPSILSTAKVEGDFVYNIVDADNGTKYAVLLDFSEEGKQKEIIIVPEYIGEYKVGKFNTTNGFGNNFGEMKSDNLKRIYFKYEIDFASNCFANCPNLQRILIFNYMIQPESFKMRFPDSDVVPSSYAANVSFWDENTLYWIDDYEYGTIISNKPQIPEKEGFIFCGWYKEPDLINKWDFESDKLPDLILDEYGQAKYQETKLYAKWEIKK